jgi:hypothetical protein
MSSKKRRKPRRELFAAALPVARVLEAHVSGAPLSRTSKLTVRQKEAYHVIVFTKRHLVSIMLGIIPVLLLQLLLVLAILLLMVRAIQIHQRAIHGVIVLRNLVILVFLLKHHPPVFSES